MDRIEQINRENYMNNSDYENHQRLEALVSTALDLGEQLLQCGGEVARVEDTIRRLCHAYGADSVDVFTITSSIIVTAHFQSGDSVTQTRRISGLKFNLSALEALNDLSRRACSQRVEPEDIGMELAQIGKMPKYDFLQTCGIWALVASSFSIFFGGNLLDAIAAGVIAILLCMGQAVLTRLEINSYFATVLCSVAGGLLSNLVFAEFPVNPAMINIGVIMLLIPGIALTNSIRDIFSGDTMSGILRCCEALVLSVAIAWGFAVTASPSSEAMTILPTVQLLAAIFGSLGFSLLFNVRGSRLIWCCLGGGVAWAVVLVCEMMGLSEMMGFFVASMALTVYGEIMARLKHCPVTIFVATATIPLIPGGSLYNTMRLAMDEEWSAFSITGLHTAIYAILISAGILVVMTVVHGADMVRRKYHD
ncbi:MAG: threonine/serine exporter family protein [Firmicutes bacterium]|nr:threonine/serine exporter family protein [Bacillota bacterium]